MLCLDLNRFTDVSNPTGNTCMKDGAELPLARPGDHVADANFLIFTNNRLGRRTRVLLQR